MIKTIRVIKEDEVYKTAGDQSITVMAEPGDRIIYDDELREYALQRPIKRKPDDPMWQLVSFIAEYWPATQVDEEARQYEALLPELEYIPAEEWDELSNEIVGKLVNNTHKLLERIEQLEQERDREALRAGAAEVRINELSVKVNEARLFKTKNAWLEYANALYRMETTPDNHDIRVEVEERLGEVKDTIEFWQNNHRLATEQYDDERREWAETLQEAHSRIRQLVSKEKTFLERIVGLEADKTTMRNRIDALNTLANDQAGEIARLQMELSHAVAVEPVTDQIDWHALAGHWQAVATKLEQERDKANTSITRLARANDEMARNLASAQAEQDEDGAVGYWRNEARKARMQIEEWEEHCRKLLISSPPITPDPKTQGRK